MTLPFFDPSDDDRRDLESAVAEAMADLSAAPSAPRGVSSGRTFTAADVEWISTNWITRLAAVQGWLRFSQRLRTDSPEIFVENLAAELSAPGESYDKLWLGQILTVDGLTRLRERTARAIDLLKAYQEDLDDESISESGASQRWAAAWDNSEDDPDLSAAEPVSASTDVWPISEFASRAKNRKLNLSPSYQRGDVWPTPDAQILMESILRGIPLPSVIILKPQNSATGVFEVVDGKQRLTAILRFIGKHPKAVELVEKANKDHPGYDLLRKFHDDYRMFRLAWKNATGQALTDRLERENYFPFKLRSGTDTALNGALEKFRGKYYCEISNEELAISDSTIAVEDIFENTTNYKIPVIQYTKASPRQIHEVFKLYNKQGKQLNAEEIRNAMYHQLGLMRGLLVAAGDHGDSGDVASFLRPHNSQSMSHVAEISEALTHYDFGSTRYKRTKVLSWLTSLLLLDTRQSRGLPSRRSTAGQIDALLRAVESDTSHTLRDDDRLGDLFELLGTTMEVHRAVPDAWNAALRGSNTQKWQEMPLVGTLLGVAQTVLVHGEEDSIEKLEERASKLHDAASSAKFRKPDNIQTATQWDYISRLAINVALMLDVDPAQAHQKAMDRFGVSGIATLVEVEKMDVDKIGRRA